MGVLDVVGHGVPEKDNTTHNTRCVQFIMSGRDDSVCVQRNSNDVEDVLYIKLHLARWRLLGHLVVCMQIAIYITISLYNYKDSKVN